METFKKLSQDKFEYINDKSFKPFRQIPWEKLKKIELKVSERKV